MHVVQAFIFFFSNLNCKKTGKRVFMQRYKITIQVKRMGEHIIEVEIISDINRDRLF